MEPATRTPTFIEFAGPITLWIGGIIVVYLFAGTIVAGVRKAQCLRGGMSQKDTDSEVLICFWLWWLWLTYCAFSSLINFTEWATYLVIGRPEEPAPPPPASKPPTDMSSP